MFQIFNIASFNFKTFINNEPKDYKMEHKSKDKDICCLITHKLKLKLKDPNKPHKYGKIIQILEQAKDKNLIKLGPQKAEIKQLNNIKAGKDECLIRCLGFLARKHELDVTENYIRSLIHGDIREAAPSMKVLTRYLDALNYVKRSYVNPINVDFLAEIYGRLLGTNELTSFYRNAEDTNRENRVLIDRIYTSAPVSLIEGMMEVLFSFLTTTSLSSATKAAVAYYYINYIRPFPDFSDEIALLIAKAILAL